MTFGEVEQVIGSSLPASARKHRAWWSNNPLNSVITYAWLAAGYKTEGVSIEHESLTFRKSESVKGQIRSKPESKMAKAHPVFSCMGGTATISTGTDLTEPSLPEWEAMTMEQGICHE
ncbi:MAG: hypothetical protein F4X97_00595 [Boseongicola sp. SB0662_bin_57]|nr:hypothetical protein [Boseongicola sp. SB0662_bin_57]